MATDRAKYEVEDRSEQIEELVANRSENGFTPLQDHFADWVTEKVDPEFKSQKERDAFTQGAAWALVLRMEHQRSPENHEFQASRAEARTAESEQKAAEREERREAREAAKAEKEEAAEAKRQERAARKAAKDSGDDEDEAPSKPARRGRATPAKAATPAKTAAKAPATNRRPARRPASKGAKAEAAF